MFSQRAGYEFCLSKKTNIQRFHDRNATFFKKFCYCNRQQFGYQSLQHCSQLGSLKKINYFSLTTRNCETMPVCHASNTIESIDSKVLSAKKSYGIYGRLSSYRYIYCEKNY